MEYSVAAGKKRKGKKQWKGKLDLSRGKNIKAKLVARERERALLMLCDL